MKNIFNSCGFAATLVLAGCASNMQSPSQSVDNLSPDTSTQFMPAQNEKAVKTQIITQYIPVALPGQLMAKPLEDSKQADSTKKATDASTFLTKEAAVQYAYKHAMVEPNSNDFFNAMMTYQYMPGAMYVIYTAPMHITDIALQPGEKIISEAAGDTLRWQVSQTYSGQGEGTTQHILVKPNAPELTNTMIITTNQRVYHLLLKSTNNDTFMMAVKWQYPGSMVQFSHANETPDASLTNSSADSGNLYNLNLSSINFNYAFGMVKGQKPSWYPVRVFSNGHQTFIQFPQSAANQNNLPVLFVADDQGQYGTMVNWQLHWPYMIVDTVLKKAQLRSGVKSQDNQVIVQLQETKTAQ